MKTYEYLFAALADPTRRRILELLRGGPRSVSWLAGRLPVTRPAVSQHLRALLDVGLVEVEPRGRSRIYSVAPEGLEPLRRYLEDYWGGVLAAFGRAAGDGHGGRDDDDDGAREKGD